jgi:hypothetical protein
MISGRSLTRLVAESMSPCIKPPCMLPPCILTATREPCEPCESERSRWWFSRSCALLSDSSIGELDNIHADLFAKKVKKALANPPGVVHKKGTTYPSTGLASAAVCQAESCRPLILQTNVAATHTYMCV